MRVGSIRAMRILIPMIASICLLSGCGISNIKIPKLYKVAIQQGNVITQDMVAAGGFCHGRTRYSGPL